MADASTEQEPTMAGNHSADGLARTTFLITMVMAGAFCGAVFLFVL